MRPLRDMDTIQIEITNACVNSCSNCTRLCGHHPKPFFMSFDDFRQAVDSLASFPKIVGVMGGEPLLHPEFDRFCEYLHERIPPSRCGLWTTLPRGHEHYAPRIVDTFWNVLLNDHTHPDLRHSPVLIAAREHLPEDRYWYRIHHCYYQNNWSASITPKGAYFCEVAAAMDMVLGYDKGWPVEPRWWKRCPNHFLEQMEAFCPNCGGALHFPPRRDVEGIDDVSPWWLDRLQEHGSPKVKAGRVEVYRGKPSSRCRKINLFRTELWYAKAIAAKYGLSLVLQRSGYLRPVLNAGGDATLTIE
jgi:hypothetical protein